MTEEWTKKQQDEFTGLYTQYKKLPHYNEAKANQILFSSQFPYNEAKIRLQKLIDEGLKQNSGLEAEVKSTSSGWSLPILTRERAAVGLATIVLALAAVYTFGAAPLVAATYTLPLY